MSTVDSRVVEMRFDNSHFEKNVSTTMSTLDKLKMKLNFSKSHQSLENIGTAAKKVDMSGLANGVENVRSRFSALEVMGVTALANITNSAVNAGKNMVKALTIDPIKTGFEEYETKMGSIQTILSNTQHNGTTMDDVLSALNELNLYADKTIYNFQQMTRNIGTFTAAGLDLETSVKSIQGIANLAAVSGSTSQQASTAMYQLSQALATGTVRLMDWNSVVNAGMGGKVFQDALIRTAAMLDGSADKVEEWKEKHIDSFGSFRDSLTRGEWLTTEVLSKTLEQFTMAAEEGSEQWNKFKESLKESGYTEEQAEAILKMANNATDAATKVKTFTQLIEVLKESAQSGWAQTWELIVGDFEEAKEFFGELSDIFGGIIGDSANRRNAFLGDALMSNWDKLITKINEAGIQTTEFEESVRKIVGDKKLDGLIEKFGSLEEAVKAGEISSDQLKKALDDIAGTKADETIADFVAGLKEIDRTLQRGHTGEDIKKVQTALEELGYSVGAPGIDGIFGPLTEGAVKAFQAANNLNEDGIIGPETLAALEAAGTKVEETTRNVDDLKGSCDELLDVITKKGGRELLLESLMNVIQAILRPIKAVGEALRNTFSVSPDQLYNALEWLSGMTSKLVPKGILDSTTWANLTDKINHLGISTDDFVDRLGEVLADNGINVDELTKKYGSLAKAFEAGAISMDYIKEALLGFEGITESLLIGGENVDKLRRTFEGLLAIIDIVTTIAGGGFKIAFKVLSSVLEHFNLNILDVTAAIGDSLVDFRDWFDSIFDIGWALDFLVPLVKDAAEAIGGWFYDLRNSDAFVTLRGHIFSATKRIKEFFETLKTSENIPGDIISGLASGIASGVGAVWGAAVQLASAIVDAIKSFLGIHSPSTVMIAIGGFVVAGLVTGLMNGTGPVAEAVQKMLGPMLEGIKNAVTPVVNWLKKIDWGAVFAAVLTFTTSISSLKFANAFENLTAPLEGVNDVLEGVGVVLRKAARGINKVLKGVAKVLRGFGRVLNSIAFNIQTKGIKNLAISLLILVGAFAILTMLPADKIDQAMDVLTSLVIAIAILAVIAKELSNNSASFKKGEGIKVEGMITGLIAIGAAILMLAFAVKVVGGMNIGEAIQGFIGIFALMGVIIMILKACSKITDPSLAHATEKIGKMFTKIGVAMLILAVVAKIIAGMSWGDMGKAAVGMAGLTAILMLIVKTISKMPRKNIDQVGSTLLKLSFALGILVIVAKMIAGMSWGDMGKAAIGMAGLIGIVALLVKVVKMAQKDAPNISSAVLSIAGAVFALGLTAKILSTMTWDEMKNAAVGLVGLVLVVKSLVKIVDSLGKDAPRIAGTLLALAGAIAILAGIAVLLGFVPLPMLLKGVFIVAALGGIMAGMTYMLKYAKVTKNASKAIMWLAIAIGIMAAAVAALSFIPFENLAPAVVGLGLLMGVFALVIKATKGVGGVAALGPILGMVAVIAAFGAVIYLLKDLDPLSVLGNAFALALLMVAMAGVLAIVKSLKMSVTEAAIAIGSLLGMCLPMWGLVELLKKMSGVEVASASVDALIKLASAMTLLLIPLSILGGVAMKFNWKGIGAIAIGIGALTAMWVPLATMVDILKRMNGVENATTNVDALVKLATALTLLLIPLTGIGAIGLIGGGVGFAAIIGGIGALTAMWVPLATMVDILKRMNGVENATTNVDALVKLATALTLLLIPLTGIGAIGLIGGGVGFAAIIGGIGALTAMWVPLATMVDILKRMNGVENATTNVDALVKLLVVLTGVLAVLAVVGPLSYVGIGAMYALLELIGVIGIVATAIGYLVDEFPQLQTFLDKGLPILEQIAESIGTMIGKFIGGIGEGLTESFITMAENISTMMDKLSEASEKASGIEAESFDGVKELMDVMVDIGKTSVGTSFADMFTLGGSSMGKFISSGVLFFSGMGLIGKVAKSVELDSEAIEPVIAFAESLIGLQKAIEPIGGVVDWFTGRDDLGKFGENVADFMADMMWAMTSLQVVDEEGNAIDFEFDTDMFDTMISVAERLATLQSSLEPIGGVVSWFAGRKDLKKFGKNAGSFIKSMIEAMSEADGITINSYAFKSIMDGAERLAALQTSLDNIGGMVTWFAGRDDLGKFGENVADFIYNMRYAFNALDAKDENGKGFTFNEDNFNSIFKAAMLLIMIQKKVDEIGGIKTWWTGKDDLGTFGENLADFITDMMYAFAALNSTDEYGNTITFNEGMFDTIMSVATKLVDLQDTLKAIGGLTDVWEGHDDLSTFSQTISEFMFYMMDAFTALNAVDAEGNAITFNEDMFKSIMSAASELSKLQTCLEPLGGVISWFKGQKDLGTFGEQVSEFGSSMATFADSIADVELSEVTVTKIITAGTALAALQGVLPEDGWLDGKMNLMDFGIDIEEFAYAMEMFGAASTKIDATACQTVISTAYKIKSLITSLAGLDTSGLATFTGIGTGGFGADGAAYKIGQSMSAYSELVAGINISAVNSSATAANILTSIMSSLVGIDPTGIENFKVSEIASEMAAYSTNLADFNSEAVTASVSAANSLKGFITGLAGLDTSGIGSFKTAIDELSTVNVSDFIAAFEGANTQLGSVGASMTAALIEGMKTNASLFGTTGEEFVSGFASGAEDNTSTAEGAFETMASDAVEAARGEYSSASSAGSYLVDGFAAGITAQTWVAESAAVVMAQAAITAAKETLAINSPSKVFRAIGYSIPEGFAMGIDRMSWLAKDSAIDMAKTAISGVSKSISRIADMVNSNVDAQPTIRPVMDLSDVASGASAINSMLDMGSTIGLSANAGAVSTMMARRSQNGVNDDVVHAINKLRDKLDNVGNTYNTISGITYDDSSNISEAVTAIVRAARMERRV